MKRKIEENTSLSNKKFKQSDSTIFGHLDESPSTFIGNKSLDNIKLRTQHLINSSDTIVNLGNLNQLINKVRSTTKGEKDIKLRFVLATDYTILFAEEGRPSARVPAHFQMVSSTQSGAQCITAGNIKINSKNEITFISNKSGDFQPSWQSLQYVFAVLFAMNYPFSPTIKLEKQIPGYFENELLNIANLKAEVMDRFSKKDIESIKKTNAINTLAMDNKAVFKNDKPKLQSSSIFARKKLFADVEDSMPDEITSGGYASLSTFS